MVYDSDSHREDWKAGSTLLALIGGSILAILAGLNLRAEREEKELDRAINEGYRQYLEDCEDFGRKGVYFKEVDWENPERK